MLAGTVVLLPGVLSGPAANAASPTTATLVVHKGGDRVGPQAVDGLPGATFDFYAGVSGTRPGPGDAPVASCVTGLDGTCSVDVPGRFAGSQGYWVVERSAPTGWAVIDTFDTGGTTTSPNPYNGIFIQPQNNVTYNLPIVTTGNTNAAARGSQWADRRDNPPFPDTCGLRIGLLLDVSGSIQPNLTDLQDAANGFVDALTGTPSSISVVTFATNAQTVLDPTAVSTVAGATTVKDAINALTASGGTNWGAGLFQMAAGPQPYDAVIMITDGNPTFFGPPPVQGPGNFTRFREVEEGVYSANALKAEGTRVIAVGVGAGVTGSANNLQAISGPVAGSDYFQTDFPALAEVMRQVALATCGGTISVTKLIIPPGGSAADAVPDSGWTFSSPTSGVSPPSAVTDGTGSVNFEVDLSTTPSQDVTIVETQQPGHTLVPQDGFNAACTADGEPTTVTDSGDLGFVVTAQVNTIVACTVLNQAPTPLASVVVDKEWTINGETFVDPDQPVEFESALSLTGQDSPSWGAVYTGYVAGEQVVIGEDLDLDLLPPGCTTVTSGDVGTQTLAAGLNTFTVTNTVSCETRLQLTKDVENPFGEPEPADSWVLTAFQDTTPAFSGTTGVSDQITPGIPYTMAESGVPGYAQTVAPGAEPVPPATGSWTCSVQLRDGTLSQTSFDGANGQVTAETGAFVVCTAVNIAQPATLTLRKEVVNQFGGTASATAWLLSADGGSAGIVSGRSGESSVTNATIPPGVAFTLSETDGPAGYAADGAECALTGTDTVIPTPNSQLIADLGQAITCTFTNHDVPQVPPALAVTGSSAVPRLAQTGAALLLLGSAVLLLGGRRRAAGARRP